MGIHELEDGSDMKKHLVYLMIFYYQNQKVHITHGLYDTKTSERIAMDTVSSLYEHDKKLFLSFDDD